MKNIKGNRPSTVRVLSRAVALLFKSAPLANTGGAMIGVLNAMQFAFKMIALQVLFDAISLAAVGQLSFAECIPPILLIAAIAFGGQIVSLLDVTLYMFTMGKGIGYAQTLMYRKLQRIDPVRYEDTEFHDDLNKTNESIWCLSYTAIAMYKLLTFQGTYFIIIGAYLFTLKPILVVTLFISFIPPLLSQVFRMKIFSRLEKESAPIRRECEHYQKTICDREYFKETRVLGAVKYFHNLFSGTLHLLTRKIWQAERKTALLELSVNLTTFFGMAASSYLLFSAAMAGEITLGAFAAVFASLGQVFSIMQETIIYRLGYINRDLGKLTNYVRLMDMPEVIGENKDAPSIPDFSKGVDAENVSFAYPGRDESAVKGISLSIAPGETIAIVGENGAGKSTLIRLLTGIYLPTEGKVTVGGFDTAVTAPKDTHRGISGVFQKYQRYKMTLSENVSISDSAYADSNLSGCIENVLSDAGAELAGVGLDDMLSPEFDGVDLSGGQWQRIAIARGLYRSNDFIVLDEPTSAIDPIEETRIYTQFKKLAEGKCAVVVTHRLGSARLADRIVVMDKGEIVSSGTHDELLALPGIYADMWKAQAKWYERGDENAAHLFARVESE